MKTFKGSKSKDASRVRLQRTRKASLNSKEHGNCLCSWWTQSSHCRKTGQRSFRSSEFSPWPQRSANLWPKSSHSVSTKTWKPWTNTSQVILEKTPVVPSTVFSVFKRLIKVRVSDGIKTCRYLNGAVVWIQKQLGQSNNLRCAIPAIGAVHQHGPVVSVHSIDHQQRRLQQQRQVLQPLGALQGRKPATDRQTATEQKTSGDVWCLRRVLQGQVYTTGQISTPKLYSKCLYIMISHNVNLSNNHK